MAAVSEDPITLWLKLGALEKLEQVVLDGYGDQLYGKTSRIPQVSRFLRQVPQFQNKIDEIHKAVSQGRVRDVKHLIDRKKLAFCRDQMGASPLHKAVLFGQKEIIRYLLDRYFSVIHARDHQGRTPLHYAAVLPDSGHIYRMLLEVGADSKATDVYGNKPEYYLHAQDELSLQQLKDGVGANRNKRARFRNILNGKDRERGFSARPSGNRVQIRELINRGRLEALEELVIHGHGDRLLGEYSSNSLIQDFLKMVPLYMERIHEVHRAVVRGRLRDVQTLLDRKKLSIARDAAGATPLHKAVLYGHYSIAQYIAHNFPLSWDCKDLEGRTALHYAAALKDGHHMYNMLLSIGASPFISDYKGKTPEYYLQFPSHLHLDQVLKYSQRANANYFANHANRIKARSPRRRRSPSALRAYYSLGEDQEKTEQNEDEDYELNATVVKERAAQENINNRQYIPFKLYKKTVLRSQPLLPPPKLKRLEVNSANIRRWIKDEDIEKLEGAVLEGYGEKLVSENADSEGVQEYLTSAVPKMVERIHAIHSAVSNDDLLQLQNQLEIKDFALAKDRLGMTPLHRAVLLNRIQPLKFLIATFPETVNARDKEGRTALHYAAAMTRGGGSNSFRLLLEAGADPRIRDNQGRTPEYYRTHHVPIPNKLTLHSKIHQKKPRSNSEPPIQRFRPAAPIHLTPQILERITVALQQGDAEQLQELVLEGHGKHIVGRTSWSEEVRQYIKSLPSYLDTIQAMFKAVSTDDIYTVIDLIENDEKILKIKSENGETPLHVAVKENHPEIVHHIIRTHPTVLNIKDRAGRTALHIAGQNNNIDIYKALTEAGADPMILDQKGRTAEYYANISVKQKQLINLANFEDSTQVIKDNTAESKKDETSLKMEVNDYNEDQNASYNNEQEKLLEDSNENEGILLDDKDEILVEGENRQEKEYSKEKESEEESKLVPEEMENIEQVGMNVEDSNAEKIKESKGTELNELNNIEVDDSKEIEAEESSQGKVEDSNEIDETDSGMIKTEESNEVDEDSITVDKLQEKEQTNVITSIAEDTLNTVETEVKEATEKEDTEFEREYTETFHKELQSEKERETDFTAEINKEEMEEPIEDEQNTEESDTSQTVHEKASTSTGDRLNELIDHWIEDKDLLRLEHVVIAGQGERLIGRNSDDRQIQEFLDLVPTYMARISSVHEAVVRGNLIEVQNVLTRKRFALSRDHLGASPLHLAVLHGHSDVLRYIVTNFPEALDGPDNEGRTPLHYAAIMQDGGQYYKILKICGADESVQDKLGNTPLYYLKHPGELTIRDLLEGYRLRNEDQEEPSAVNIWQRPPTEEIEKRTVLKAWS